MGVNLFKQMWIKKGTPDMIAEESAGAAKYHAMGDKFNEMAEQEEGHKETLEEMDTMKAGNTICPNCGAANPPTEMSCLECGFVLKGRARQGQESNKSVDTSYAGGVPNSKLARQDLEGKTMKAENEQKKCPKCGGSGIMNEGDSDEMECEYCGGRGTVDKSMHKDSIPSIQDVDDNYKGKVRGIHNNKVYNSVEDYNLSSDDNPTKKSQIQKDINRYKVSRDMIYGAEQWRVNDTKTGEVMYSSSSKQDADEVCKEMNANTMKGIIESTGKQLDQAASKSEDKEDLVSRMKAIQLKRQGAIISEREKSMNKTFKSAWESLKKARTIGSQYKSEVRRLIAEAHKKDIINYNQVFDYVLDKISPEALDTWEMAYQEIEQMCHES